MDETLTPAILLFVKNDPPLPAAAIAGIERVIQRFHRRNDHVIASIEQIVEREITVVVHLKKNCDRSDVSWFRWEFRRYMERHVFPVELSARLLGRVPVEPKRLSDDAMESQDYLQPFEQRRPIVFIYDRSETNGHPDPDGDWYS